MDQPPFVSDPDQPEVDEAPGRSSELRTTGFGGTLQEGQDNPVGTVEPGAKRYRLESAEIDSAQKKRGAGGTSSGPSREAGLRGQSSGNLVIIK